MQQFSHCAFRRGVAATCRPTSLFKRPISLTGAIERGKRRQEDSTLKHDRRYKPRNDQDPSSKRASAAIEHIEPAVPIVTSIPYTTASSEFLYGTFSVLSALRAKRRKIYKLYRLPASSQHAIDTDIDDAKGYDLARKNIHELAHGRGIEVQELKGPDGIRLFNKLTGNRPHGGIILEVSPLPKLPIRALQPVASAADTISVIPAQASKEESEINAIFFSGSQNNIEFPSVRPAHRYPFMLLLDCITNPGNFGAIVRSAWFLGVDAIIIPDHGTSPVSAVSIKASAGALELMPVLTIQNERDFLARSREYGWKFFAAAASEKTKHRDSSVLQSEGALLEHPCVLVLGNEETGIRPFWKRYMHGTVSIPNTRGNVGDVDSLNVSVAAALLTQKFFDSAQPQDLTKTEAESSPFVDPFGLDNNRMFS